MGVLTGLTDKIISKRNDNSTLTLTDDGKVYLVYNDTDSGVKQVEMT